MIARIYQPARNAMQSGQAKVDTWILEYAPQSSKKIDPLMGWIGSSDMESQIKLTFESKDEAITFAKTKGIIYSIQDPKLRKHIIRQNGYAENFATNRKGSWTH